MDIAYTLRTLLLMASAAALMVALFMVVENGLGRRSRNRDGRHLAAPVERLADAEECDY